MLTQNFSKKLNFKTEDNVPVGKLQEKVCKKIFFFASLSHWRKESDPEPDPLLRGMDPGIRIPTKMSRIPNTARKRYHYS